MFYIVEKHGMYLAAESPWSATWYLSDEHALKFYSKAHAAEVAEKNEGSVLPRSLPN